MSSRPSARLLSNLTDAELQERLLVARLEWWSASSRGIDVAADAWTIVGKLLVLEHLRRGLDPETGQPLGLSG